MRQFISFHAHPEVKHRFKTCFIFLGE